MQLQHSIDGGQPLTPATVAALDAFIDRVEDAPAGSVALIDLTGVPAPTAERPPLAVVNRWERVLRRLERTGTTTVAVVRGDCGGTAVEALLTTDLRIATTDARLHLPVAGGGVWPGMGLYRLANQVGYARLRRAVLFADAIPAARALALDLVDEVTDDVATATSDAVAALARSAGPDVAVRRQLMLDATTLPFEEALGRHLAACDRVLRQARTEEAHDVAVLV
ncbi:(3,5-dihydroxycyclohex-3-enyl)acetyl-CoA dehydratase subunit B [Micromonospora pallida]|uniref:(3,5-dihydroxycyclohex-3-enyl)acetyl-CoA dehydratase subunit B n=1 Tax=Micromonospora pallida TaxID=145854 RepID=A0A1C6S1P2_9ACTN|nr:enoyl-CoA-hydratase DpgB [Micromonospora pallida]SCL23389.1 (3,5-dihydroxycyclohex-3-enyl)acetyl-CoA dehydratase subunit B [Micromonospora pallida]